MFFPFSGCSSICLSVRLKFDQISLLKLGYVNKWQCAYYCRFGNFRENLIFANSIKRHISDVKNSRLRQDLPISIND